MRFFQFFKMNTFDLSNKYLLTPSTAANGQLSTAGLPNFSFRVPHSYHFGVPGFENSTFIFETLRANVLKALFIIILLYNISLKICVTPPRLGTPGLLLSAFSTTFLILLSVSVFGTNSTKFLSLLFQITKK